MGRGDIFKNKIKRKLNLESAHCFWYFYVFLVFTIFIVNLNIMKHYVYVSFCKFPGIVIWVRRHRNTTNNILWHKNQIPYTWIHTLMWKAEGYCVESHNVWQLHSWVYRDGLGIVAHTLLTFHWGRKMWICLEEDSGAAVSTTGSKNNTDFNKWQLSMTYWTESW